jgi:glycogen synthase
VNILTISNVYPPGVVGGYELGCAQATEALNRAGHHVTVLTSKSAALETSDRDVRAELELAPVYQFQRFQALPEPAQRHLISAANFVHLGNVRVLADTLEEVEPDVVYLWNLFGLGGLGVLGCLGHAGVPWVWHLMDAVPLFLCSLSAPDIAAERRFETLASEFGHVASGDYIACSQRVEQEIRGAGVQLSGDVHLIPNWIAGGVPPPRETFFSGGDLRIVTAGQLGEHKGTHIVIETAARLRDRGYVNFTIDIFGLGDEWPFRALAHRYGVEQFVHFREPLGQQQLVDSYASYDVFLFPTWPREPFGFAPLEAASRGCVAVVSANCGIAEWLVHGVHCLKATRDADAFADVVAEILDGHVPLEQFARRAQQIVVRDFSIGAALPAIERVLRRAAERRHDARGAASDFYPIARFAEGLMTVLLEEAVP